jgi:hypothetical protein
MLRSARARPNATAPRSEILCFREFAFQFAEGIFLDQELVRVTIKESPTAWTSLHVNRSPGWMPVC